jgi:hypothetical protein
MKLIKYSAIVLCLLLLIVAALFFYSQSSMHHKYLQNKFISYWAEELAKIKSPDDIKNARLKNLAQHFGILGGVLKGGVRDGKCEVSAVRAA